MKLTPAMAVRYDDGRGIGISAPCVVCGEVTSLKCGHYDDGTTIDVCKRLKLLGKDQRDKLKAGKLG